jgi:hypothetical protein
MQYTGVEITFLYFKPLKSYFPKIKNAKASEILKLIATDTILLIEETEHITFRIIFSVAWKDGVIDSIHTTKS